MTSSYQGIPVAKAGERFGLSQEDLEELFQMREGGEEQMGDEFNLPLTQVQFTEKGRGGTLGYKAAQTPTVTKTLGGAERAVTNISNIFSPTLSQTMASEENKPEAPPEAPKAQPFAWQENLKGGGFGTADYQAALAKGFSNEAIKEFMTTHKGTFGGSGLNIGADVRQALGLGGEYQSDLAKIASSTNRAADVTATPQNWMQLTRARGGLGQAAYDSARQAGYSDQEIANYAKTFGLTVGEKAAQSSPALASMRQQQITPAPQEARSRILKHSSAEGAQQGSIGLAGLERAAAEQGISATEAARRAQAAGIRLGEKAAALLR